jgi:hypothetical protein
MIEFVRVADIRDIVEAQILAAVLAERGIPHRIQSFHDTAYDGLFMTQIGWGVLWALPEDAGQIAEIQADLRVDWEPPMGKSGA